VVRRAVTVNPASIVIARRYSDEVIQYKIKISIAWIASLGYKLAMTTINDLVWAVIPA